MSAATAALHSIAELTFARADDLLNQVHYTSLSASGANGPTNHTALDVITGEILCSCKGTECGRACWHADLIADAWAAYPAVALARQYTTDQLVRAGTKSARMCRVYRAGVAGPAGRCRRRRRVQAGVPPAHGPGGGDRRGGVEAGGALVTSQRSGYDREYSRPERTRRWRP